MRRTRKSFFLALVAAVVALLASNWATGVSLAQEHDHSGGGDHDMDHGQPPPAEEPPPPPEQPPPPPPPPPEAPQDPNQQTTAVQWGPYTLPAAASTNHEDHVHTGSQFQLNVERPCSNCYITKMTPALVNEAGEEVGLDTGSMLHHMVVFNADADRSDATCAGSFPLGLLGQRFFASGDERNVVEFPPNYGYQVDNGSWNLVWEGSNHSTVPQTVYFQVTFEWVPVSQASGMMDVEPVWFDADQCGESEVSVPAGQSTAEWTWTANREGEMIYTWGHLHGNSMHGGGTHLTLVNETTGEQLCDSVAGYGDKPRSVDPQGVEWLSSMTVCGSTEEFQSLGHISMGDQVTATGYYDQHEADDGQMAIALAYLADPPAGGGSQDGGDAGDGGDTTECSFWDELFGLCTSSGSAGGCGFLARLLGWC